MTRAQIMAVAEVSARRLAANEIGIAPRDPKHLARVMELRLAQQQDNPAPVAQAADIEYIEYRKQA